MSTTALTLLFVFFIVIVANSRVEVDELALVLLLTELNVLLQVHIYLCQTS